VNNLAFIILGVQFLGRSIIDNSNGASVVDSEWLSSSQSHGLIENSSWRSLGEVDLSGNNVEVENVIRNVIGSFAADLSGLTLCFDFFLGALEFFIKFVHKFMIVFFFLLGASIFYFNFCLAGLGYLLLRAWEQAFEEIYQTSFFWFFARGILL
jgi:hypothetical protein